jgi:hypothetical protein
MSKPIPNPTWLTISGEVYKRLEALAIAPMDTSQTTFHADGRATFPVTQETAARLRGFSADPELALCQLLGIKSN